MKRISVILMIALAAVIVSCGSSKKATSSSAPNTMTDTTQHK